MGRRIKEHPTLANFCKGRTTVMLNLPVKDKQQFYELIVGMAGFTIILLGCMIVLSPFFTAILLACIFVLSAWPAFDWLRQRMPIGWASLLVTLLLASIFIMPLVVIGSSASENFTKTFTAVQTWLQDGDLSKAAEYISLIPWVGSDLAVWWTDLTSDTAALKEIMQEYAGPTSQKLLGLGANIGHGLLHITIAIFIAYFFFRHGLHVALRVRNLTEKFAGERGRHLLEVAKKTLIGVVYGILGTALAQGALAAFGFWIAGVPGAPFLGLMTLFLSFIPIGPPLVWGPAAYWLFQQGEQGWAIFLVAWGIAVISAIDNVLKPYFISVGSNLPFILVLFGIGGGVLAFGFLGIFIGPTLLALAYSIILELSTNRLAEKETTA